MSSQHPIVSYKLNVKLYRIVHYVIIILISIELQFNFHCDLTELYQIISIVLIVMELNAKVLVCNLS